MHSLFSKNLSIYPKGPGEANSNSRIVVAQANDVDGKPFVHERVCFNIDSKADGAFGYSGQLTPTLLIGGTDAPGKGTADVCQYTDANGRAAVEILNSDPELINTIADFDPEGLLRSIDVNFGTPPAIVTPTPKPPTPQQIKATAPDLIVGAKAVPAGTPINKVSAKKARLSSARLVKRHGKVYLVVRIKGNGHKYAQLRVKAIAKHGRKLGIWTKKVRTGKKITIRVSAKAAQARVSLVS